VTSYNLLGAAGAPSSGSVGWTLVTRGSAVLLSLLLATCAARPVIVAVEPAIWILPISARDSEQVCAITLDYPGRRCASVADIRSYLRSVRAD
jgi:hypothetical protein